MKSASEPDGTGRRSGLLRWVAVLPAAVLSGLVASRVSGLVMSTEVTGRLANLLVIESAMGIALVLGGAMTAPNYRIAAAVVLAILWSFFSGVIHVGLHPRPDKWNYVTVVVAAIAAAAGVGYIAFRERQARPAGSFAE